MYKDMLVNFYYYRKHSYSMVYLCLKKTVKQLPWIIGKQLLQLEEIYVCIHTVYNSCYYSLCVLHEGSQSTSFSLHWNVLFLMHKNDFKL